MCGQGQRHVNGTKNDHQPESAMEDSHAMISLACLVTVLPPSDSPSPRERCINSTGGLSKNPTCYQNQNQYPCNHHLAAPNANQRAQNDPMDILCAKSNDDDDRQ
jgi:hypothetical protein